MRKIAITGARGTVGTILCGGLPDFSITPIDLPERDVRNADELEKIFRGHEAVIHLAWNTKIENAGSDTIDPDNGALFANVYRAALKTGVSRVIMASSVHAHRIPPAKTDIPVSPYNISTPNNVYGAHKLFMEVLGRYYATAGLEVVVLRLGSVTRDNTPVTLEKERLLRLAHEDLLSLVRNCLIKPVPEKFMSVWATSRGGLQFYDLSNPFGWQPKKEA